MEVFARAGVQSQMSRNHVALAGALVAACLAGGPRLASSSAPAEAKPQGAVRSMFLERSSDIDWLAELAEFVAAHTETPPDAGR